MNTDAMGQSDAVVDIPREQKEVLEAMGVALLLLQNAEKVMCLCMTIVLQKKHLPLTLDLLQQQEKAERTKTLGYFLSELRKRASLHESFDLLLRRFLEDRNTFVHDLSRVPGWDLQTGGDTSHAKEFIFSLIDQTETVLKVFVGLIVAWQEQVGISRTALPNHEWFDEIFSVYKPLADHVFFRNVR